MRVFESFVHQEAYRCRIGVYRILEERKVIDLVGENARYARNEEYGYDGERLREYYTEENIEWFKKNWRILNDINKLKEYYEKKDKEMANE